MCKKTQICGSANGNFAIISRRLDALRVLAGLTTRLHRRCALYEQAQWRFELAERTLESSYDRARIGARLACVAEALAAEPAWCAGEDREN